MSYDVCLETPAHQGPCPDCGGSGNRLVEAVEVFNRNHTSNTSQMWREAGADLAAMDGHRAGDCVPVLAEAIRVMETDPERFRQWNAPNGWGSYESTLGFLGDVLTACTEHPDTTIRISR